jgi:hypothetical protein
MLIKTEVLKELNKKYNERIFERTRKVFKKPITVD